MGFVLEVSYRNEVEPRLLRTPDDIDTFLNDLLNAGWENASATVYALEENSDIAPEHELVVGVRQATSVGVVRYSGEQDGRGGEWFSRGEQVNPRGVVYAYFGTGHDFPADAEVPLCLVRQALGELLDNKGKRPTCVVWQEWQWASSA